MLATSKLTDLLYGKLSDQIAFEYLLALSNQKPTAALINELINNIQSLNRYSVFESQYKLDIKNANLIDCCGTGGSGMPHYNTSTAVSFVLAAGGLKVAKFGNRSASGISGSFDFLEYLGLPIISSKDNLLDILHITNLCFLFAPQFYPGLARLAPLRKALGKPTIFNLIGPLLNPLRPTFRILGTPKSDAQKAIADYLFSYKACKKALVVRSESGLDELDPTTNNIILHVDEKGIRENQLTPTILASTPLETPSSTIIAPTALAITPQENAHLFNELITDFISSPPYFRHLVTLNAGAGFFIADAAASIEEGQELASNLLASGAVLNKYEQCRSIYAKYS